MNIDIPNPILNQMNDIATLLKQAMKPKRFPLNFPKITDDQCLNELQPKLKSLIKISN